MLTNIFHSKYCGLMIGSLETANNNAGNWE